MYEEDLEDIREELFELRESHKQLQCALKAVSAIMSDKQRALWWSVYKIQCNHRGVSPSKRFFAEED